MLSTADFRILRLAQVQIMGEFAAQLQQLDIEALQLANLDMGHYRHRLNICLDTILNSIPFQEDPAAMNVGWGGMLKFMNEYHAPALIVLQTVSTISNAPRKHREDFARECGDHWRNITTPTTKVAEWLPEYRGKFIQIGVNDEIATAVVVYLLINKLMSLAMAEDPADEASKALREELASL